MERPESPGSVGAAANRDGSRSAELDAALRSAAVGWYFLDSLSADIESLRLYAGIHRRYLGYYRMLSHRLPYAV